MVRWTSISCCGDFGDGELTLEDDPMHSFFFLDTDASGSRLRAPKGVTELLGAGGTGAVYALQDQDDVVVKAAHLGNTIMKEREILTAIAAAGDLGASSLLRLAASDNDSDPMCMMLTPRYHPLQLPGLGLPAATFCHRLAGLIRSGGQLRELHRVGFVHGDVRPPNIMQTAPAAGDDVIGGGGGGGVERVVGGGGEAEGGGGDGPSAVSYTHLTLPTIYSV